MLDETDDTPHSRKRWAWLLAHVFKADMEHCPRCNGPLRWAEVATTRADITRLLAEQGIGPRAPPSPRAQLPAPEQLMLRFSGTSS